MIGSLKGEIILKTDKFLILETSSGVGYKINVSPENFLISKKEGDNVFLWIYTHVREDAMELFGFLDYKELALFEMLISVSGIGPRSALVILSVATVDTLARAISTGDVTYLTKISGIGKKTAEKIVLELRDKLEMTDEGGTLQEELDALEALKSLGYSQGEAREALKRVSPDTDTNTKVREALKILGGHAKGR
ncbi:MAG: Holliday junction branch migration protein RuvA [Candidatus Pacebacteria bacterium]|nr:Holliday junction branch migration protein RuvA [Candidatus Paceibacterota bacterium]MBP9839403.1 Holliday junction branch migration protein RuvA [Candidatus Paceibacterota bacterium]